MIRLKDFFKSHIGSIIIFFLATIGLGYVITQVVSAIWYWF